MYTKESLELLGLTIASVCSIGGVIAGGVRWIVRVAIPMRRSFYIETLLKEERGKKWSTEHTSLWYALELHRVLLRNDLIEKRLANGKIMEPSGVFGSSTHTDIPYMSMTSRGYNCYAIAMKLPLINWLNKRWIARHFREYIESDARIANKICEYDHLKDDDPEEHARLVTIAVFTERWETFFFSKIPNFGPVGLVLNGRGYLFYGERRVEEASLENVMRVVERK